MKRLYRSILCSSLRECRCYGGGRLKLSFQTAFVVDGGLAMLSVLREIKQLPLRLLFGHAHVGFAVGKSDVQFLPLL